MEGEKDIRRVPCPFLPLAASQIPVENDLPFYGQTRTTVTLPVSLSDLNFTVPIR